MHMAGSIQQYTCPATSYHTNTVLGSWHGVACTRYVPLAGVIQRQHIDPARLHACSSVERIRCICNRIHGARSKATKRGRLQLRVLLVTHTHTLHVWCRRNRPMETFLGISELLLHGDAVAAVCCDGGASSSCPLVSRRRLPAKA
jgi:hypothetical protein